MNIVKELPSISLPINNNWKVIPGLESYAVNEDGIIKALPKIREGRLDCLNSHAGCTEKSQRKYKEHIIKPRYTSRYWYVCLMHNGIKKYYRVHRLVYKAFVGEIPEGMVIDHIDGNRNNNNINNLRCVSRSENCNNPATKNNCCKPILQINPDTKAVVAEYPSAEKAVIALSIPNNVANWKVLYRCCNGKRRIAWNFMWQYKENYEAGVLKIRPPFCKPIIQCDLQNNYIAEYPNASVAARTLNMDASCIHKCASGKLSSYNNFIWKYKNI